MKKILLTTAIIFVCTFDALAGGKGTIHETDTQIYVEYADDAVQDNPEVFDQTENNIQQEQVEEQKKQEENLLNQRRKQKYDSWAAEWSVQKKKLEGLRMEENGIVIRNETE